MKLLNKVKISLWISLFIIILFHIKAFAVAGTVTEITVNVREKASTDSKKIMYVTQDDVVEVLEKDGEWYKIKVKGTTGYIFGEYIKVDDSKLEKVEETTNQEEITEITEKEQIIEKQEEISNTNLIIKNKTQIKIIPNISSSIIYTASKDIKINIIDQISDWTYISGEGILGWVRTDKIVEENEVLPDEKDTVKEEKTEDSEEETTKAYIKYDTVNLREKASTSSNSLAKLKLNDEVTVLQTINSVWSKVEIDGKTGYISTELLSDKKQEVKEETKKENDTTSRDSEETSREEVASKTEEASKKEDTTTDKSNDDETSNTTNEENNSNKVTGSDIVEYAKKYLGYDYVYGGASPKGFDCSGFTYYVYKNFGYTLSRSSKAQAKAGKEVKKSELQLGDLLIYKNTSLTAIGHVGIYIGDNKMIHASEPGVGVTITDIDSKSYKYDKRYVTARRIIE